MNFGNQLWNWQASISELEGYGAHRAKVSVGSAANPCTDISRRTGEERKEEKEKRKREEENSRSEEEMRKGKRKKKEKRKTTDQKRRVKEENRRVREEKRIKGKTF